MKVKFRNIRRFTLLNLSFLVMVFLLLCTGIFAYFIMLSNETNEFTVNYIETELTDEFTPIGEFKGGSKYVKEVSVENTGSAACYVRVFAIIKQQKARDSIDVNFDRENWTEKGDFWYYNEPLAPGDTAKPLFTELNVKEDVLDFEMICYQEAVQAEGVSSASAAFDQEGK